MFHVTSTFGNATLASITCTTKQGVSKNGGRIGRGHDKALVIARSDLGPGRKRACVGPVTKELKD